MGIIFGMAKESGRIFLSGEEKIFLGEGKRKKAPNS